MDARYNVDKSRLGTAANEFIGRLQAEEARIDLGVAEQKLKVQEANMALHTATNNSRMASLTRQRDQAQGRRGGHQGAHGADGNPGSAGRRGGVRFQLQPGAAQRQAVQGRRQRLFRNESGGNPRHELAGDGRQSGGDRPRAHRCGKRRAGTRGRPAGAADSDQDYADFAAGGVEHRLSSHAKFSRLRGARRLPIRGCARE